MGAGAGEVSPVAAGAADIGPLNAANYRITDGDRIGEGGLKQKYRQNVAAIRTLRRVQAESRPPTAEEKSAIAKYVGWGGLPQVFATPDDAPQWRAEQEELAALLEPILQPQWLTPLSANPAASAWMDLAEVNAMGWTASYAA